MELTILGVFENPTATHALAVPARSKVSREGSAFLLILMDTVQSLDAQPAGIWNDRPEPCKENVCSDLLSIKHIGYFRTNSSKP